VGSLSKSFGLAGWRVGYLVVPDRWIDAVLRAQDALMIHAAVPSQYIAIEALTHRSADDYVQRFAARVAADQASFRTRLTTLPWVESVTGNTATFLWVTLEPRCDADTFAAQLLDQHGIGVLEGGVFGAIEPSFRLGIACADSADLTRAWDRLRLVP
jgi:aspartate/methionine/tyrosine aminotransferase